MELQASNVRKRLDSLLQNVIYNNEYAPKSISPHGAIPDWLLSDNGIHLISHEFDETDNSAVVNLSQHPPILFSHLPLETFKKYPILGPEAYPDPKIAEIMLGYKDPKLTSLRCRVSFALHYLERWAGGFLRKGALPESMQLPKIPGLTRVRHPHGLFSGVEFSNNFGHPYDAHLFEYDSELGRFARGKPHLMILGEIQDYCQDGSISYGELALLLTAMRSRAFQRYGSVKPDPESNGESAEGADVPVDKGFLFEDELRFPVLMISIVGLQHARIFYACMDGKKIVIRQSKKYSMLKKDEEILNFLSSILLSSPLDED